MGKNKLLWQIAQLQELNTSLVLRYQLIKHFYDVHSVD